MPEPLIQLKNVCKSFGSQVVLDGIDLIVEHDLVTTIIGRSGIGKSVLLKLIVGLLSPDKGDILYQNTSLLQMSRSDRKRFKREFSYMFQHMALFDSMTVFENVALPLEEKTRMSEETIRGKVMRILEQLDLHDVTAKYPSQISGGMRKRVALARALITEPRIVFFDEPTTGLDPIRKNEVLKMIARCQGEFEFTAVIVSHDIPDVFSISQKVAMLEHGKILFAGTPEEIVACTEPAVRQFLQGETDEEPATETFREPASEMRGL
jgi:phospholipid/cholesterol/gamma-HCH transport system ATP-binding protein